MAQVTGQNQCRLLYVWDRSSGHKFLVDTGAQVSVFPASPHDRRRQKGEPLVAANSSKIDTFGKRTISLDLGFRRFKWLFVLADVNRPMLGADFFFSNHLLIDIYTSHIIDAQTYESIPVQQDATPAPGLNVCSANEFADIIKEFPSITQPQFSTRDAKHGVEHCIPILPRHYLRLIRARRTPNLARPGAAILDINDPPYVLLEEVRKDVPSDFQPS